MEKREYLIILYDYYGELLNDDNKRYFEDYYFDNLSLGEIAENYSISRNAVHKHIKTSEEKLKFYEEKLGIYNKDLSIRKKVDNIKDNNLKDKIKDILGYE